MVARADRLVILYPPWLGSMPVLLESFFEQPLRRDLAFKAGKARKLPRKSLNKIESSGRRAK